MAALAASEELSIRTSGTRVDLPNHDVCRLSYYLRCCTLDCGIDIIVDDLVRFQNAHTLPEARQKAIYELAAEDFSADKVLNKTIFLDEEGTLCGNSDNEFLELKKVVNVLAVSSSTVLGGHQTNVSKIMVFKRAWLKRNYFEPLERLREKYEISMDGGIQSLVRLLTKAVVEEVKETQSGHCRHCKGLDAACGCDYGCKPTETTKCSAVHHCEHCKGLEGGACACKSGCAQSAYGKCVVVHSTVTCDACGTRGVQGTRYKCEKCFNYDLCEECYRGGQHETTHPFSMIERVGSTHISLQPRQQPKNVGHGRKADSPTKEDGMGSQRRRAAMKNDDTGSFSFVGDNMSITEMKSYLRENCVSFVGVFEKKSLLKLVWETQVESMGAKQLNGFIAAQNIDVSADMSVGAKRMAAVAAFEDKYCMKEAAANREASFCEGDVVQLCGLKNESMNGKIGTVVDSQLPNGRVQVQLVEDAKARFNIRPHNLQAAPADLD